MVQSSPHGTIDGVTGNTEKCTVKLTTQNQNKQKQNKKQKKQPIIYTTAKKK